MAQEIKSNKLAVLPCRTIGTRSPICVQKWIAYSTAFWGEAYSVDGRSSTGLKRQPQ
jgi:hypothetical protein